MINKSNFSKYCEEGVGWGWYKISVYGGLNLGMV